jgi:hypothetical protein
MIRFGKGKTAQITAAAKLQLSHDKGTHFLCETRTAQTRLQKAIRQIERKELRELDKVQKISGDMSTGQMLVMMRDFLVGLDAPMPEQK